MLNSREFHVTPHVTYHYIFKPLLHVTKAHVALSNSKTIDILLCWFHTYYHITPITT